MGFSGGGSNILLPHKHDGRVSQDGGELDFNNITQSNSTSGQVFYSNGTALQQLAIGAPTNVLTVSGANLPAWSAAAGGLTQNIIITTPFTSTSGTFVAVTGMLITLSNQVGGNAQVTAQGQLFNTTNSQDATIALADDGVILYYTTVGYLGFSTSMENIFSTTGFFSTDGSALDLQMFVSGGTGKVNTQPAPGPCCAIMAKELY